MDADGSGEVNFEEFATWWKSNSPKNPNPIPTEIWCSEEGAEEKLNRHDLLFFRLPCMFARCINREEGLEEHGPAFTLWLIQFIMLMNALYTAVVVIWVAAFDISANKVPGPLFSMEVTCPEKYTYDCIESVEHCEEMCRDHMKDQFLGGYFVPIVMLFIALLAPVFTIGCLLPRALFDFVMVTCIEGHINKDIIRDVILDKKKKLVSKIFSMVQAGRKVN